MRLLSLVALAASVHSLAALPSSTPSGLKLSVPSEPAKRALLQDLVTWDENSLFIKGERVMIYSGEFHPFRLPSPSLWLDIFQKIRAAGFNTISYYNMWALNEQTRGEFRAEGVFDMVPFYEAALKAGIYLIARPGPYIHAESSGGGLPGWVARIPAQIRSADPLFLNASNVYLAGVGAAIAKYQITNGGPIILTQIENEYSNCNDGTGGCLEAGWMQHIEDGLRKAGMVIPTISNDGSPRGRWVTSGGYKIDIYGHDWYPMGIDCSNPDEWYNGKNKNLPTNFAALHQQHSPLTPYSILEYQSGSPSNWGGPSYDQCAAFLNHEYARVFNKNNYGAGVRIYNLYMTVGGTNWGGISYSEGFTSYDYGAIVKEDRSISREKYSEIKLEAQVLKVSPSYPVANPVINYTIGQHSPSKDVAITPLLANDTLGDSKTNYFVVRHANFSVKYSTSYTLVLPSTAGNLAIPQLSSGGLTLPGRDSKVHVTDYKVAGINILYSTAEIFTWKKFLQRTVLLVYGGPDELHEIAVNTASTVNHPKLVEGKDVKIQELKGSNSNAWVVQFISTPQRKVVQVGDLWIYLLDRNSAYNYWVPDLGEDPYGTSIMNPDSVIVKAGYLVRNISVSGNRLHIDADFNSTTNVEIIGAPTTVSELYINGAVVAHTVNALDNWEAHYVYSEPDFRLPDLTTLDWSTLDSLPEISPQYNDSLWRTANITSSSYPEEQVVPVSLYAGDYGYHVGAILYRASFNATRSEDSTFTLTARGGRAFAVSIWANGTFIGSYNGSGAIKAIHETAFTIPAGVLTVGKNVTLTIVLDHMGLEHNIPGASTGKIPRGIVAYDLQGVKMADITWRLTGNLGGEQYYDKWRGPLNEGGLFAERKGYTAPFPPLAEAGFVSGSPFNSTGGPGVWYHTAKFNLDLPSEKWDIPLQFVFENQTETLGHYRSLLYINGWQFGRYVSNIGPQSTFPVPEGILNYNGENWIGLTVWALNKEGAKVPSVKLQASTPLYTGRQPVTLVDSPSYKKRDGSY
ncbi:glycoside hydrolase family 35 protein [Zopfia rhizophila CBS 207.26]|uniref:Beta-galactosidase n=1 Tax=Zopfia rhizophila CBS 207.26 TaxID=1314779 RepID=A0A6A6E7I5_9PEZI|nr:glycoside hydrolase family 35 protein [Zopfia rhizophila CBS 207.26]